MSTPVDTQASTQLPITSHAALPPPSVQEPSVPVSIPKPMVAAHIDLITKFDPNTKNIYHGPIQLNSSDMGKPSLDEVDYTLNEISKYLKWVSSNYADDTLKPESYSLK